MLWGRVARLGGFAVLAAITLASSVLLVIRLCERSYRAHVEESTLAGRCPNCGYDMRGLGRGRCPECGV